MRDVYVQTIAAGVQRIDLARVSLILRDQPFDGVVTVVMRDQSLHQIYNRDADALVGL